MKKIFVYFSGYSIPKLVEHGINLQVVSNAIQDGGYNELRRLRALKELVHNAPKQAYVYYTMNHNGIVEADVQWVG